MVVELNFDPVQIELKAKNIIGWVQRKGVNAGINIYVLYYNIICGAGRTGQSNLSRETKFSARTGPGRKSSSLLI